MPLLQLRLLRGGVAIRALCLMHHGFLCSPPLATCATTRWRRFYGGFPPFSLGDVVDGAAAYAPVAAARPGVRMTAQRRLARQWLR